MFADLNCEACRGLSASLTHLRELRPSREQALAVTKTQEALMWHVQAARLQREILRESGVEGEGDATDGHALPEDAPR